MQNIPRLVKAVLGSSASILPIYFVVALVSDGLQMLQNDLLFVSFLIAFVIAFIGVICVGLPLHFLLIWFKRTQAYNYALVGYLIPMSLTLYTHPFGEDGVLAIAWQALLLGVFGALVALIFWKIAVHDTYA